MRYSLLELAPIAPQDDRTMALERALAAAVDAERTGYHRVWFGEHPSALSYASHDPAIMISAAIARTSRIRLGSGAVLLNHYSPFSVAERFLMLGAMAPGRIDLGLGRSTSGPVVDLALRQDRRSAPSNDFDEQVREIVGYFHHAFDPAHPFASIDLTRGITNVPGMWLMGSSGGSAGLAGQFGIGYTFGAHINPAIMRPALQRYRESFRPTPFGTGEPQIVLGLNIVAADDEETAHELTWPARALRSLGKDRPIPTVAQARTELSASAKRQSSTIENGVIPAQISGTPKSLTQQLEPLVRETGVAEIVLHDMVTDPELRQRSRELIAETLAGISANS
ncbi:MsnO8 family LLM class oxidoreductase [Amycolatopsis sp. GM8]|uniref:MsnO8 family LLM class oxidoreductase n=1 Tax=Amycolatopsis sp. GM8 TaxID=2896530 RepID=UPI001F00CA55|nr:MsnO8 family LLM class oxidoreductase [Amycolatopsis sp. GM8]